MVVENPAGKSYKQQTAENVNQKCNKPPRVYAMYWEARAFRIRYVHNTYVALATLLAKPVREHFKRVRSIDSSLSCGSRYGSESFVIGGGSRGLNREQSEGE